MSDTPAPPPALTDEIRARRVAVARDVKQRIALGKLRLSTGGYMSGIKDGWYDYRRELVEAGGDLQPHVDEVEGRCTVCALGAVMLSKARVCDAIDVAVLMPDTGSQYAFHAALGDVFDELTLLMIESAFERTNYAYDLSPGGHKEVGGALCRAAVIFGQRYPGADARCEAVMDAIVAGNGEFVLEPMTVAEYDDQFEDGDDTDEDD